ncbi:unnamed protein product [Eruca vesicaria subsp. sativa]|uniref:Legume lectin domain-containing protein n=1 Tax=Eruca vesicaria subsp. sativa TaxID=29727 RepID=A0ABC8LBA4_ERUVS|nr:unnamed protein product [Eruca vesicaria subsp. sativa]
MAQGLHLTLMIFFVHLICISSQQETGFIYNGFGQTDLYTDGVARILPEGQLQLTDGSGQKMGHAFFKKPFEFTSPESLSFSTHFVCALVPKPGYIGGHGIAFVMSASMDLTHAVATQFLGLFNISTHGSSSSHLVAVELDTALSAEFDDINANHVGIDVNSLISIESTPASYFSEIKGKNESIQLLSGAPIQVWVDYGENVVNVYLAPHKIQKPSQPLLSTSLNLSESFPDRKIFIGFSGATGTLISYQYILGWSFSRNKESLQTLDVTKLPRVPPHKAKNERPSVLLIVLLILLAVVLFLVLGAAFVYRRRKYAELREEWEKEYGPHRFSYKALYKATQGFHKDGLVGKGAEEVEMVLKLGLLCMNAVAELRPSMEEVMQYLNKSLKLPDITPNSPGIGSFVPLIMGSNPLPASPTTETLSASLYSSSSANDSTFVTHSVVYGHGR